MKTIYGTLVRAVLLLVVLLAGASTAQAQGYDTCTPQGRVAFHRATELVRIDSVSPANAGPGAPLTLTGRNFTTLPPSGVVVSFVVAEQLAGMRIDAPVTVLTDSTLQVTIPTNSTITLDQSGAIAPGRITLMALTYYPQYPSRSCGERVEWAELRMAFSPYPGVGSFPAPYNFRVVSKSDARLQLGWQYPTAYPIDGFRVYMHWCQPGVPLGETCSLTSRNPAAYDLGDSFNGEPFWIELTSATQLLAATKRSEPLTVDLSAEYPTFAGATIHLAMTAYSASAGESVHHEIATVAVPDRIGCTDTQLVPSGGNYDVTVTHFTGETDAWGRPWHSPFPGGTNALPVTFVGSATAYGDAKQFPIVERIPYVYAAPLPYYHYVNQNTAEMRLGESRGYNSGANVVVDGRFQYGGESFYATAHLAYDSASGQVWPVALLAGEARPHHDVTIGMVSLSPQSLNLTIQQIIPPNGNLPGRIQGSVSGVVWMPYPDVPPLPGMWPSNPGEAGSGFTNFKNVVQISFDLPLNDDRCW